MEANTDRVARMNDRTYDIAVFGATGFTGGLVAAYLADHAPPQTRWAVAGRNTAALEKIRAALAAKKSRCPPTGIISANVASASSLAAMARDARVVLTTVGPYCEFGEPVVRACVEQGADYVDITGEPEFVEQMVEQYDDAARAKKVRIVNCCGFDSIPHDLGVLFTVGKLPEGVALQIEGFVKCRGTFSGGTWHSAIGSMGTYRAFRRKQAKRRLAREAAGSTRTVLSTKSGVHYVRELSSWACPLPTIDPQVVQRSARTIDRYGPEFHYGHFARIKHISTLVLGAVGVGSMFALAQLPVGRELLLKVRKPGVGPSAELRAKGWFNVTFIGRGGGKQVVTEVTGGDPGYTETAKMIAESALALALDQAKLPARYGVVTPAVAMGDTLIERLQSVGIGFGVVSAS